MSLCKKLRQVVMKCDLFRTTEYFRYKGEPEYRTLTGGVCSVILVSIFIIVFANSIISTFAKSSLSYGYNLIQNTTDSLSIKCTTKQSTKFMFAVGLDGFDMNSGQRYFDLKLSQVEEQGGASVERQVQLSPCKRDVWSGANSQILEIYDRFNFSRLLCPPEDQNFKIVGSETGFDYKYIKISAMNCSSNSSSRPCASHTTIDSYLASNPNFKLRIYFINGLFNPSKPQQVTYYLEDRNQVPFNTNYGGENNIFMSRYSMTTDESISPVEDKRVTEGGVVNFVGQYLASRVFRDQYAHIKIRKSHVSWDITRKYQKIDSTLSYIGGLFGFIMVVFMFLQVYTEYSYEVEMGDKLYYYEPNIPFDSNKFHFLTFLLYLLYSFLDFFGCAWNSDLMKKFNKCRQEIQKQFDVTFLMKRIVFFERSLRILFEDHQFKGLHMHQKLTLKEAQELRSYYRLRDKLKVSLDDRAQTRPIDQQSDMSGSNKSSQLNYTEDYIANNIFEDSADRGPEIVYSEKHSVPKSRKVYPAVELQDKSKEIITISQSIANPRSTIHIPQSGSRIGKKGSELGSNLKMLRKESQSGNPVSRKILEGVGRDLVKNMLLRIEQSAKQAQNNSSDIVICQHEEQYQIRISKRRQDQPKQLQQRMVRDEEVDCQSVQMGEKGSVLQKRQNEFSSKGQNFEYIG